MATAFINEVLVCFPESQIDLVVKSGFEGLPLPHRGQIRPFDKRTISAYQYGRQLREEGYDRFYVLPPSFSSALMAFGSRATLRYGYRGSLRSLLLNRAKSYRIKHRDQHLVSEYLQLLEDEGCAADTKPGLVIDDDWIAATLSGLSETLPRPYVSIAPGAIYGPAKQWPPAYFQELLAMLDRAGISTVIIGTAADYDLGQQILGDATRAFNLCGKTSLNQLIAVLAQSQLLISNDSGTMHIMAALQMPQIAVFGSTSTVWTGPVNEKAEVISLQLDCSPCFKRECPLGHTDCLNRISPQMVWERVETILNQR